MNPESLKNLFKFKKHANAVLLGSGPSIKKISKNEWECIQNFDIWAVNNWVYHPTKVPNFYHIETKWYDYDLLQRRLSEKFDAYKNVIFIFPAGKIIVNPHTGVRKALHGVAKDFLNKIEYNCVKRDNKRTHKIFNADYSMHPDKVTKSYDISMTGILELMYRMDYKKIVLFGIDLKDSWYFWSGGGEEYGEVHHQWNKQHENKDPKLPHNTHKVKDFIIDFNKRWMLPRGKEILIGHEETLLFPGLRYSSIKEV